MSATTPGRVLSGARQARASWPRRLVARALGRDLRAFVVPGPDVARAYGLDLAAAGLSPVDTPRHAGVLVLVGGLPADLKGAAAVAYAQMPRPRAVLGVGAGDVSPLPGPDASAGMGQGALEEAVAALRRLFAEGAFSQEAPGFDVDEIRTRTEYVCPMHPEVVGDGPGSCPKCGMDLVPRESAGGESAGGIGHDHADHSGQDHAGRGGMDRGQGGHEHHGHEDVDRGAMGHPEQGGHDGAGHGATDDGTPGSRGRAGQGAGHAADQETTVGYTCPMHPEVRSAGPGSCPICGMNLVAREDAAGHGAHGHGGERNGPHEGHGSHGGDGDGDGGEMDREGEASGGREHHGDAGHGQGQGHDHTDHGDMGFMSMVEMTKDLPPSSDGLRMERVEAPFGPLFPGLPGGVSLRLTLDGDTVAAADAGGVGGRLLGELAGPAEAFADRLSALDPLSPAAYRLLAVRAVEEAAGISVDEETALARIGALERERAASHLNWLSGFAHLLGYPWLEGRAARLQLALLRAAGAGEAIRLRGEVSKLARRVERTPLLRRKLRGIGRLPGDAGVLGPVARAGGTPTDARAEDEVYRAVLGFEPVVGDGTEALSRLLVRLEEAQRSLELIQSAGHVSIPALTPDGAHGYGTGEATVETPRGAAKLRVTLEGGAVRTFELDTPSTAHLGLVEAMAKGEELANALIGVASLDISPWGVAR